MDPQIVVIFILYYIQLSCTTNYVDHVTVDGSNVELHPDDILYSQDGNTRLRMRPSSSAQPGEWHLQQRSSSSSSFSEIWTTDSEVPSQYITSTAPLFAIQVDRNLVVYTPPTCSPSCKGWQANNVPPSGPPSPQPWHFFVHNDGYAYLLDDNYDFAGFRTDPTIGPTSSPILYPAGTLTAPPTPQPTTPLPTTPPTTKSPTFQPTPSTDPNCDYGILSHPDADACCAATCVTCGGSGCGNRPGGASHCCEQTIWQNGRSCNDNPAPCNMYPTSDPTEDPSEFPSSSPSKSPIKEPTKTPTEEPTDEPTDSPTSLPTESPSLMPTTLTPTNTHSPSSNPSTSPTNRPTTPTPTLEVNVFCDGNQNIISVAIGFDFNLTSKTNNTIGIMSNITEEIMNDNAKIECDISNKEITNIKLTAFSDVNTASDHYVQRANITVRVCTSCSADDIKELFADGIIETNNYDDILKVIPSTIGIIADIVTTDTDTNGQAAESTTTRASVGTENTGNSNASSSDSSTTWAVIGTLAAIMCICCICFAYYVGRKVRKEKEIKKKQMTDEIALSDAGKDGRLDDT